MRLTITDTLVHRGSGSNDDKEYYIHPITENFCPGDWLPRRLVTSSAGDAVIVFYALSTAVQNSLSCNR